MQFFLTQQSKITFRAFLLDNTDKEHSETSFLCSSAMGSAAEWAETVVWHTVPLGNKVRGAQHHFLALG